MMSLVLILMFTALVKVSGLGSMSSIAVSYGEDGPVFCGLSPEGSHQVTCYGADASIVYGAPSWLPFLGITAGDGFICGLRLDSNQPYCWGNNVYVNMGVPQPMVEGAAYSEISSGDHHVCGLRKGAGKNTSLVDCWGYNMTVSHKFYGSITSLTAGSVFNCGLFASNQTAFCWGDESGSRVISSIPMDFKFRAISAGGFHVCGVLDTSRVYCWGRSLSIEKEAESSASTGNLGAGNVDVAPVDSFLSIVGGRFHACGIRSVDREVVCWGFRLDNSVPPPVRTKVYELVAGDYFTCAVSAEGSLKPICWGTAFPTSIPMAVSPGMCLSNPCGPGFYELSHVATSTKKVQLCKAPNSSVCLHCSDGCPVGKYQSASCSSKDDRTCDYDCSSCTSSECTSFCSARTLSEKRNARFASFQMPIFVVEIVFAFVFVTSVSLVACLYIRHRLRKCHCSINDVKSAVTLTSQRRPSDHRLSSQTSSFHKDQPVKIRPDLDEMKIRRARVFSYEELEKATDGFNEESQVGKGSFSCVFKGVLRDGTIVAVKRAVVASDAKNSKEFHTELDLLSRLNHAHLLDLLGYCEERGERLLVYEFMAHGSLHQHLHGKNGKLKEQLDWIRRVTIAVQAARGIEYLHGYACPPVIHRDIKSSNILIDEEHNARVSDFGLSLLGPSDNSSPLSEPPAGTFGYLDPEYYRLHYLTTKSDVYSFGVLLLEILSGRKAIDMQADEGNNIVEWAVPLIKSGDVQAILDPVLKVPPEIEALRRISNMAMRCVRMRGKERPSMDQVTTGLERGLVLLMGSPCNDQPILPTEVVLGSSRLHKKSSMRSSNSENDIAATVVSEEQRFEFRAPSWITFPSVTSSQRRKLSLSDGDGDGERNPTAPESIVGEGLRCLEEEIVPASPQEELFLQHNF
ncbi:Kinase family protein [Zostera marina]|uniref:non-specific serine/threonine protein kinase n=1 Tax=Zostera marina TaxID=29655 RepID=A0A0K9P5Z4_ZOSMR|nr:Kinase family protein [Zostera marina]